MHNTHAGEQQHPATINDEVTEVIDDAAADEESAGSKSGRVAATPSSAAVAKAGKLPALPAGAGSFNATPITDGAIPRIIHHMHKDLAELSATQRLLRKGCMDMNPDWEFRFWDDVSLKEFIRREFMW